MLLLLRGAVLAVGLCAGRSSAYIAYTTQRTPRSEHHAANNTQRIGVSAASPAIKAAMLATKATGGPGGRIAPQPRAADHRD